MNSLLARIRRSRTRGGRHVVVAVAVAYLSAAFAPCVAAADPVSQRQDAGLFVHAAEAHGHVPGHAGHGVAPAMDGAHHGHHQEHPAPSARHDDVMGGERSTHCPHCLDGSLSGAAIAGDAVHATCSVAAALTDLGALQGNDNPHSDAVPLGFAAFTPPPLASPLTSPQQRVGRAPSVPLNVLHCVFLI